jgi:hypothetical protein
MKCGKCKRDDDGVTVEHVRACYGGAAIGQHVPLTTVHDGHDGQYELLQKLMEERDIPPLDPYDDIKDKVSKSEASALISNLINNVKRPVAKASNFSAKLDVPAGYYATPSLTGNNDLDFWHVQKPTEGKWAGYTFVKRVLGGHSDQDLPRDSKRRIKDDNRRLARATQTAVLEAIVKFGIEKSNALFGTELKFCRVCGIHLTDEISRELGIGPVCRAA